MVINLAVKVWRRVPAYLRVLRHFTGTSRDRCSIIASFLIPLQIIATN